MCAWAGPGADGRHPLFGIMNVSYQSRKANAEARMVAFVEAVFEAMTPAAR